MTEYIDAVFGPTGILARHFEGYVPRPGQIEMARAVGAALEDDEHLLVEAPTGVGKSLAYSVPATHHAVNEKKRVVIATANIALQEQLVEKDLPLLAEILPWDFRFALLKGKNNYLCLDRRYQEEAEGTLDLLDEPGDGPMLTDLTEWAGTTETGDVSELPFQPLYRLWRRFSTTSDDCKGSDCRFRDECFALKARAAAEEAHVVVANYHLLFAHLQVRAATGQDLVLPAFDVAILDEAHKAADIARDFFGARITVGGVRWAARLLKKLGKGMQHRELTEEATRFFERLDSHRRSPGYKCRLKRPDVVPWSKLCTLLGKAATTYQAAQEMGDEDANAELRRVATRCETLAGQIRAAMTLADKDSVVFIEADGRGGAVLRSKPIEVSGVLEQALFASVDSAVLTSATLTTGGSFDHIAGEMGVPTPRTLSVESPFDFERQALLVVPDGMPNPGAPDYPDAVADAVAEVLELAEGRTLGLFTSYRNLDLTYQRVSGNGHRILRQGDRPRTALVEEFRRDVDSVLLGTESFWAGVDVQGEALSCVVIDRLPFPSPDDPVLDAISERDRRWFTNYSLPRAVIAFKQGFGRLIRSATDRGVVVVLDQRIVSKSYGKVFTRSLPPVLKSRRIESVQRFLDEEP